MHTEFYDDIGFTVVCKPAPADQCPEHNWCFFAYQILATDENGNRLYNKKGSDWSPNFVDNLEDADKFLRGHVKWDGCSNWEIEPDQIAMLHFCDKEQAQNVGVLFGRIYDLAAKFIPRWDGD